MNHSEFQINDDFFCGKCKWKCTDIGTRTIAAIKLNENYPADWLNGPPYQVEELVFDENDFAACEKRP